MAAKFAALFTVVEIAGLSQTPRIDRKIVDVSARSQKPWPRVSSERMVPRRITTSKRNEKFST